MLKLQYLEVFCRRSWIGSTFGFENNPRLLIHPQRPLGRLWGIGFKENLNFPHRTIQESPFPQEDKLVPGIGTLGKRCGKKVIRGMAKQRPAKRMVYRYQGRELVKSFWEHSQFLLDIVETSGNVVFRNSFGGVKHSRRRRNHHHMKGLFFAWYIYFVAGPIGLLQPEFFLERGGRFALGYEGQLRGDVQRMPKTVAVQHT